MSFKSILSSNSFSNQEQDFKLYEFTKNKLIPSIAPNIPDLSKIKQIELPETIKERLIGSSLEQMAKKAEEIFQTPNNEILDSPQFLEFMSNGFLQIITSIVKEAEQLPPNIIADCGVNEAVFTHALDEKPIVATESLATCVGIAGYGSENKSGFVIHIATEIDLEASKEMLTEKIMQMSKNLTNPIQLHLRGGIARLSEPLVEAIEKWVQSASEKGCQMVVISKEVLTKGLLSSSGIPNTMSLSLDTRNGVLSNYDSSTNLYAKQKNQINNAKELDNVFMRVFTESALKKPGINIVYFSASH